MARGLFPIAKWDIPHYLGAMSQPNPLLQQIDAFLAASGMKATTFGRKAVNDWGFIDRLRAGGRCWPETEERVRSFINSASQGRAA
jgi:hypothetical protein